MVDPDLQITGRPGHPHPEILGGPDSKKSFQPFRPQFGLKIREGGGGVGGPRLDPPLESSFSSFPCLPMFTLPPKKESLIAGYCVLAVDHILVDRNAGLTYLMMPFSL